MARFCGGGKELASLIGKDLHFIECLHFGKRIYINKDMVECWIHGFDLCFRCILGDELGYPLQHGRKVAFKFTFTRIDYFTLYSTHLLPPYWSHRPLPYLTPQIFYKNPPLEMSRSTEAPRVGVHCVAGLGRAPVLVAIALIEFELMDVLAAVEFIRSRRKGSFNTRQLRWLQMYERRRKKPSGLNLHECCVVS